jgi:hypothetical protein
MIADSCFVACMNPNDSFDPWETRTETTKGFFALDVIGGIRTVNQPTSLPNGRIIFHLSNLLYIEYLGSASPSFVFIL